jgi:hypothetical protein
MEVGRRHTSALRYLQKPKHDELAEASSDRLPADAKCLKLIVGHNQRTIFTTAVAGVLNLEPIK